MSHPPSVVGRLLTERDHEAHEAFRNFLSWGELPSALYRPRVEPFAWPPAVFAYVAGLTTYCPPRGTL